jgi:uncharacterized protein (TIGR03435 family)
MRRLPPQNSGISVVLAAAWCAAAVPIHAQPPSTRQEFDIASVKPAASLDGRALLLAVPGRLQMTNLTLRRLILIAYGVQDYQLSGGPQWIDSEHYDIEAKTNSTATVQQMEGPMLQALLGERFRLAVHQETRQLPVYQLSVVKAGGLRFSKEGSCAPYSTNSPPPATSADFRTIFCGLRLTVDGASRTLDGKGVTMAMLAANLSRTYNTSLGRNVLDTTGLTGAFDIHLNWSIDPMSAPSDDSDTATAEDRIAPSLFTALQEQLGLKLESGKGPIEVVVIDHIEKPSAD